MIKILIFTQNESVALAPAIDFLLRRIGPNCEVVGAVVFDTSPFGKRKNLIQKIMSTLYVFGASFVFRYGLAVVWHKIFRFDVRQLLKAHNVKLIEVSGSINSEESLATLTSFDVDLFVSITGNQIFKKPFLDIPRLGTLNLHTALLPKYRGLLPSFWVLKNKEKETGVSVFFVDEGIDSGPILVQKRIQLNNMSQWELIRMTKFLGMEAIFEGIKLVQSGDFELIENNDEESTYYSFPTRQDVIEFKKSGNKFF